MLLAGECLSPYSLSKCLGKAEVMDAIPAVTLTATVST
jgi:hypothetical protein